MRLTRLDSAAELIPLLADDAYASAELHPGSRGPAWVSGAAAAWVRWSTHRGGGWLTALGPPNAAAALAAAVLADEAPDVSGLTLPRGGHDLLPAAVEVGEGDDWDWWWSATRPAPQAGEAGIGWLDDVSDDALRAFLAVASPRHSAAPGVASILRWCGVDDAAGLGAIAAWVQYRPGVPHLASIAVRPALRGQGLGGAVTAWLTRELLSAGAPVVTLGMYADNEPARRVYRRLGYTDSHHFTSRALR